MDEADLIQRLEQLESRLHALEQRLEPRHLLADSPLDVWTSTQPELIEPDDPMFKATAGAPAEQGKILHSGIEQTIGLKWAGWIGAVVLVIGAGLGIKFAIDQGWLLALPPVVRLGMLAMAGVALIGVGEVVYRRVHVLSAVGLFAAGVSVLFVVSYSGHAYYDLYPRDTAFVFMAVCTIIGALVARRGNLVSIAVVSFIGGNLAPTLLSDGQPLLPGFLVYLLMLQVASLALAYWGAQPKWWTLRGLSLVTTCIWVLAVINQPDEDLLLAFMLVFACLYQFELLVSAAKSRIIVHRAGFTFSMLATAALTAGVLYLLQDSSQIIRLGFTLSTAAAAAVVSVIISRWNQKSAALRALAHGYAFQSLALVVVAVPVAISGIWISAAWGMLAIALAALGWFLDLPAARLAGPVVWALALGDLAVFTMDHQRSHPDRLIGWWIGNYAFPPDTLMSGLLAVQGQFVAKLIAASRHRPASISERTLGNFVSAFASVVYVAAALHGLSPMIATLGVLVYTALLVLLDRLDRTLNLLLQAGILAMLMTMKWGAWDLLFHRLLDPVGPDAVFLSVRGLTSSALLLMLLIIYFRARASGPFNRFAKPIQTMIGGAIVAVIFWILTFAIDQAFINLRLSSDDFFSDPQRGEQLALCICWSLFALCSVAIGFGWKTAGLRYFGLALFAVTLVKVVAVDLSQVSTGYRILSFLGLGILLLGTSVLYGKVSPVLLQQSASRHPE